MRLSPLIKTCGSHTALGRMKAVCPRRISSNGTPVAHHYVVLRDDLPVGTAAAMIVHAAGETYKSTATHVGATVHAVVLVTTRDELEMLAFLPAAHRVREPDPPWNNEVMAVAWPPTYDRDLRKALRHLKLYGTERNHR